MSPVLHLPESFTPGLDRYIFNCVKTGPLCKDIRCSFIYTAIIFGIYRLFSNRVFKSNDVVKTYTGLADFFFRKKS